MRLIQVFVLSETHRFQLPNLRPRPMDRYLGWEEEEVLYIKQISSFSVHSTQRRVHILSYPFSVEPFPISHSISLSLSVFLTPGVGVLQPCYPSARLSEAKSNTVPTTNHAVLARRSHGKYALKRSLK